MANNVHLTGYGSLGSRGLESRAKRPDLPELIDSDLVKSIASAHGKTPAQGISITLLLDLFDGSVILFLLCWFSQYLVLLRWSVDTNVICIPKSVNPNRIKENFDIFDFKLTEKGIYLHPYLLNFIQVSIHGRQDNINLHSIFLTIIPFWFLLTRIVDLESLASLGSAGLRMFTQEWTGVPTFF